MVSERKYVDAKDQPNLADVVRAVHDSGETVFVRAGGDKLTVMRPLTESVTAYIDDPAERRKAFMAAARSMKGLISTRDL